MPEDDALPFPPLIEQTTDRWHWPLPPFAWRHLPVPDNDVAQPCRIESHGGACVEGEMLGFDPAAASLVLRTAPGAPAVTLPFSRFRRLTLTLPLSPAASRGGVPLERIPAAAQERDYRLQPSGSGAAMTGRTAGHVEAPEGLYLFEPVDEDQSVLRLFVPRSAYARCEFGTSAEETAAQQWITTPEQLLDAIERQQRMPVLPIGRSMLELGLLTQAQLDRALAQQTGEMPLGEMLVAGGVISRTDLQTAIAHKMGYPLVDLSRFPVEPAAAQLLPQRRAAEYRALPLMIERQRLIVAVDRPQRVDKLRTIPSLTRYTMVPVLASKGQIMLAIARVSPQDLWSQNLAGRPDFSVSTR
ncbi:MAG TPA: hypothetical protein VGQ91_04710 [Ideonella sp.]|nr:hypothetical protein [Ideonella sp.]